jgi:MFS family permease
VVGYGTYNVVILKERNIENYAWALSIVPYVNIVTRLALGQIVKKLGEGYTILVGCVSMIAGMVLLFMAQSLSVLAVALVLYNVGYQLGYSTINALVMKRSKSSNRGASTATWMIMMDVGQGIGAVAWGFVGDISSSRSVVYLCLAAVFAICALITVFVLIPDCKKWEAERAAALAAGESDD